MRRLAIHEIVELRDRAKDQSNGISVGISAEEVVALAETALWWINEDMAHAENHSVIMEISEKIDRLIPKEKAISSPHLFEPISSIYLRKPAREILARMGIKTIADLVSRSEIELMANRGFGMTSLHQIHKALKEMGLSLADRRS